MTCIFILNQREIRSNEIKQYVFGCLLLVGSIFHVVAKEIERLKNNMYSQLPHFRLAVVIDHHFIIFVVFIIIGIINVVWQFRTRWNRGVPNRRLCDIWWIIRNWAHVQFQKNRCFNESMSKRYHLGAMTSFIPPRSHSYSS